MEEEWKVIDICNTYEVSNLGRVRNRKTKHIKQQYLAGGRNGHKYKEVHLWSSHSKRTHASIHRLVAIAFIPNPDNKPEVNHLDTNRENNIVSNLEWATRAENEMHKRFMDIYTNPKDVVKYRECTDANCPHHMKTEPCGYCSIREHQQWIRSKHERQAISNQFGKGSSTPKTEQE